MRYLHRVSRHVLPNLMRTFIFVGDWRMIHHLSLRGITRGVLRVQRAIDAGVLVCLANTCKKWQQPWWLCYSCPLRAADCETHLPLYSASQSPPSPAQLSFLFEEFSISHLPLTIAPFRTFGCMACPLVHVAQAHHRCRQDKHHRGHALDRSDSTSSRARDSFWRCWHLSSLDTTPHNTARHTTPHATQHRTPPISKCCPVALH